MVTVECKEMSERDRSRQRYDKAVCLYVSAKIWEDGIAITITK